MDEYLSSLVKKGEAIEAEPEVEVEAVPESAGPILDNEAEPEEHAQPDQTTDESAEDNSEAEEELSENSQLETEPANKEDAEPEKEQVQESKLEKEPEKAIYGIGQVINVTSPIRVYKTPNTSEIARSVTGNVVYLGEIGEFSIIEFMKSGFGLVKGYTKDLR